MLKISKLFLIAFVFIALASFSNAASVLKASHSCYAVPSDVCIAKNLQLVSGSDLSAEYVYLDYDLSNYSASNKLIYETSTGTKVLLTTTYVDGFNFTALKFGSIVYYAYMNASGNYVYIGYYDVALSGTSGSNLCSISYLPEHTGAIATNGEKVYLVMTRQTVLVPFYCYIANGTQVTGTNVVYSYYVQSAITNSTVASFVLANSSSSSLTTVKDYNLNTMALISTRTVGQSAANDVIFKYVSDSKMVLDKVYGTGHELYLTDGGGSNRVVLTTTGSFDEYPLTSVYRGSDGTAYITYQNGSSIGSTYFDYFCSTSTAPVMGQQCGGVIPKITIPDVVLTSLDEACCLWADGVACKYSYCVLNEDWLHAQYLINGRVALPSSLDGDSSYSDTTKYIRGINATCKACCMGCASNPGCFDLTFKNSVAKAPSQLDWTKDLNAIGWGEQRINVVCSSNMSSTTVTTPFDVKNTAANYTAWSLVSGSDGVWKDVVRDNQLPQFKLDTTIAGVSNWRGDHFCQVESTLLNLPYWVMGQISKTDLGNNIAREVYSYSHSTTPGNSYPEITYDVLCMGVDYPLASNRMPSRNHQRSFVVESKCGTRDPTYVNGFIWTDVNGNQTNGTFYTGQNIHFSFKWVDPANGGWNVNHDGYCKYQMLYPNGTIVANSDSTSFTLPGDSVYDGTFFFYPLDSFAVGNYVLTINCSDTSVGGDYCMLPATYTKSFSVVSSSCSGDTTSCGTTSCMTCAQKTCDSCEDGYVPVLSTRCTEQICDDSGTLADCIHACWGHRVYELKAWSDRVDYPCLDPKIKIYTEIHRTKGGSIVDGLDLGATCRVILRSGLSSGNATLAYTGATYGMVYDQSTKTYTFDYSKQTNKFSTFCGSNYSAAIECTSSNFSSALTAYLHFSLSALDYCSDGTMKSQCVSERTGSEDNRPLYCDSTLSIVNMSSVCGCPNGMNVNLTSNACEGNKKITFDIWQSLSLSWILLIILIVPVLLYAAKIMHIFD